MSEDRLQQECYVWFHNNYPHLRGLLFHVPNGGSRNAREGAKFKAMGVFPGVADFIFFYKNRFYAIELKTLTGTQSKKQKYWQSIVLDNGATYVLARTVSEFKMLMIGFIANEN